MSENKIDLMRALHDMGACEYAQRWAVEHSDAEGAWNECTEADWLIFVTCNLGMPKNLWLAPLVEWLQRVIVYIPVPDDQATIDMQKTLQIVNRYITDPCEETENSVKRQQDHMFACDWCELWGELYVVGYRLCVSITSYASGHVGVSADSAQERMSLILIESGQDDFAPAFDFPAAIRAAVPFADVAAAYRKVYGNE